MEDKHNQDMQMFNQNMHQLLMQEQRFQQELMEIDEALKDLPTSSNNYKIVGKLMISQNKESLIKELDLKKESLNVRILSLNTKKKSLQDSIKSLQSE